MPRGLNPCHMPICDPLEPRRLLSAQLASGLLRISGTANPDTITVNLHNHQYQVTLNGVSSTFAAPKVHELKIRTFAGNDSIQLTGRINIRTAIFGQRGDDIITGSDGGEFISGGG